MNKVFRDDIKVVIFTGAGVSVESGISTFRDNGGLWDEYNVEEVATINAWYKDKTKMLGFYNRYRNLMKGIEPNIAHKLVADLQNYFPTSVITQNVDDLHEKAGSTNVYHLHGKMSEMRSSLDPKLIYPYEKDIQIGDKCEKGSQLRPNVVWFGEDLDSNILNTAMELCEEADVMIIIGTSMQVQPAASLPFLIKETCLLYYIDPADVEVGDMASRILFEHYQTTATDGMQHVYDDVMGIFINHTQ